MPTLHDFEAHTITINPGKVFPKRSQIIPEYQPKVQGNTVTCYIPINSGDYFAAWWWPKGKRKGTPYSVQFFRDGELVTHPIFGEEDSAYFDEGGVAGEWEDPDGKKWHFQFSTLKCTGKVDNTEVPDHIGKLELVIRNLEESQLSKPTQHGSDGTPGEDGQENQRAEEDEGERNEESDWEDDREGDSDGDMYHCSGRAALTTRRVNQSTPPRRFSGKGTKGGKRRGRIVTTKFSGYKNSKPRQTHTAELVQPDGVRFMSHGIARMRSIPEHFQGDEKDVIARFIFCYTSKANIEALISESAPPQAPKIRRRPSGTASPQPKRPRHEAKPSATNVHTETPPIETEEMMKAQAELDKLTTEWRVTNKKMHKLRIKLGYVVEDDEKKPEIIILD